MRRMLRRLILAATTFTCGGANGGTSPSVTLSGSHRMATVIGPGLVPVGLAAPVGHLPVRSLGGSPHQRR